MSAATVLSSKFQLGIPKSIREAMDLKAGQRFAFLQVGSVLKLVPYTTPQSLFGSAKGANPDGYRDRPNPSNTASAASVDTAA